MRYNLLVFRTCGGRGALCGCKITALEPQHSCRARSRSSQMKPVNFAVQQSISVREHRLLPPSQSLGGRVEGVAVTSSTDSVWLLRLRPDRLAITARIAVAGGQRGQIMLTRESLGSAGVKSC